MIKRIKEICDYVSRGATPDYIDEGENKVMNQATFSKGWLDESNIRYTAKTSKGAQIKKGDLLMASTGGGVLGKVFYFDSEDENFYADSHVTIMRNSKGANLMKYLYYHFYLRYDEINATMVKGSTNQTELQRNYLLSYELDIPTLAEQRRIVDYLDTTLSEIDRQVYLLTRKRDAYIRLKKSIINHAVTKGLNPNAKMKDSGIEWIGQVPEQWEVKRLKDVSYLYSGLTGKAGEDFRCDDVSKTKPYIPFTKILNNFKIDTSDFPRVVMTEGEEQNRVKENDILFLMSSEDYESIAKTAVVTGKIGEVYLNSFCRGLRFISKNVSAEFVNYQLQSSNYRDALRFEARGFTRINIKVEKISSMFVTLPPLPEQRSIAAYLDDKCGKIDSIVANLNKQISCYGGLKRSLIDEVITGKRAV